VDAFVSRIVVWLRSTNCGRLMLEVEMREGMETKNRLMYSLHVNLVKETGYISKRNFLPSSLLRVLDVPMHSPCFFLNLGLPYSPRCSNHTKQLAARSTVFLMVGAN